MFSYDLLEQLSKEVGECFYIFDRKGFIENYNFLKKTLKEFYDNVELAYALKANYLPSICNCIYENGGYLEICSELEYDVAVISGINPKHIIYNGPCKDKKIILNILLNGGIVNIDSYNEFEVICKIADENPAMQMRVGVRVNLDTIDGKSSRFGIDTCDEKFPKMLNKIKRIKNLTLAQIHCHVKGRTLESWRLKAVMMLKIYKRIASEFVVYPETINLGGGLPIDIKDKDKSCYNDFSKEIISIFSENFVGERKPVLFFEPGAALVSNYINCIMKIREIKQIRERFYAFVAGDRFFINPLNKKYVRKVSVYNSKDCVYYDNLTISGTTCMEDDILYEYSGEASLGGYIVFESVGAYTITLKPPFINFSAPIICFNEQNRYEIIKRQETSNDVLKICEQEE